MDIIIVLRNYSAKGYVKRSWHSILDECENGIEGRLSVFPSRVGYGMDCMEGVGTCVRPEAS